MQLGFAKAHHKNPTQKKIWAWPGLGELPKFCDFHLIFLQQLRLATSNLVCSLDLRTAIINHTKRKSGRAHGLGKLPKLLEFPFNISATAEATDFNFGMQLGFAKAHRKITPTRKSEAWPTIKAAPKI